MSKKNIEKWSLGYWFLKGYAIFLLNIFYKRIHVQNYENVPKKEPVIFALNHQNALMDALAIHCTTNKQLVFLARADIFKNPLIARFLTFIKILPIYRIRDGANTLNKNIEIFKKSLEILKNKKAMGIMPEGSHGDKRQLRPLKKGIFKIAFKAEEENNNQLGVKILPVGLDYSNYQNLGSYLHVTYGKPIIVSDYYKLYKKNEKLGMDALKKALVENLKVLMINIQNSRFYDLYQSLREIYNFRMRQLLSIKNNNYPDKFKADKKMIEILDKYHKNHSSEMEILDIKVSEYNQGINLLNLKNWLLEKPESPVSTLFLQSFLLSLCLPLYFYGVLNNYFPYKIPIWLVKKIKDKQFHSSFKFVMAMILFPVFYLFQTVLVFSMTKNPWIKYLYIVSIPISGIIAFNYYDTFKKISAKWRYFRLLRNQNERIISLRKIRNEIIQTMDSIVNSI